MTEQNIPHRCWLEVNLNTLRQNYRICRKCVPELEILCVVKANAYGMGVQKVAEVLAKEEGFAGFCVATYAEAEEILHFGLPVQVLGRVFDFELDGAIENGVSASVNSLETAREYSTAALRLGKTMNCEIKVDSGMGRFGIPWNEAVATIREIVKLPGLNVKGILSHLATYYDGEESHSAEQERRFRRVLDGCAEQGLHFDRVHLCTSAGTFLQKSLHAAPFTHVREGMSLYGDFIPGAREAGIRCVYSCRARLAAVKMMRKGDSVGYNQMFFLDHDMPVGVVSAGYADGVPLALTNRGFVLYRGRKCPVVGRVAMDYMMVSLDGIPLEECRAGDVVTLIGRDGDNEITPTDWAALKHTHEYEIATNLTPRMARTYIGG